MVNYRRPFFVSHCLPLQMSGFPLSVRVSYTTFWQSRRGRTPSNHVMGQGFVVFSCYLLCIFLCFSGRVCSVVGAIVFAATIYRCGARHSYRCNLPENIVSFLRLIFLDPLSPSKQGVHAVIFLLEFFLAQKRSLDRAPRCREGRVDCLESGWTTRLDAMVPPTIYILWHLHVQHALVLHMFRQFR